MVTINTKQRLSVSVDAFTVELIEDALTHGKFRNKSHIVEVSIQEFLNPIKTKTKLERREK